MKTINHIHFLAIALGALLAGCGGGEVSAPATVTPLGTQAAVTNASVKESVSACVGHASDCTAATIAGSPQIAYVPAEGGFVDGTAMQARFYGPTGLAVDQMGNAYVADTLNHAIRKITPAGVVTTLAGNGAKGFSNGTGKDASFNEPKGVAVDTDGNVYVADTSNHVIRKITPAGVVTTFAGGAKIDSIFDRKRDGVGTDAAFSVPTGVAVDAAGTVYVADSGNNVIRKITATGVVTTLAGGAVRDPFAKDAVNFVDGTGAEASFRNPTAIAVDSSGNAYVADLMDNAIRKISPAGVVSTLAGSIVSGHDDKVGTSARFQMPTGVAVDRSGNVYVTEIFSGGIRVISPAGEVRTLAGDAGGNFNLITNLNPAAVAVGSNGTLFFSEALTHRIRTIAHK